jgi:V8-like Glu-specific endopeptidase
MKRGPAVGFFVAVLLLALVGSAVVEGREVVPSGAAALAPCLTGDPYELAELADVISRSTPPSAPVVINRHLTVQFVRSATIDDSTDEVMGRGPPPGGDPQPREAPVYDAGFDGAPLRVFNTRTQLEYRVTMSDAMIRDITTCHERDGRTEAGGPIDGPAVPELAGPYLPIVQRHASSTVAGADEPARAIQPFGWSNNDDTRIVRTPTTLWPWRTITQSSSWPDGEHSRCTMTLIGPRHLITAAHCLVDFQTTNWKARKLTPARNGPDVEPYGVSRMTPNPPPGEEAWYIVPDPWLDPNTPDTRDKYQWDIGLVLILDRLGNQTGWMGYGAYPASDLNQRKHLNRGYPGCLDSYAEKPEDCQVARLYGDTQYCDIGYYHHPGSNNWNRQLALSCDLSRGHSGSPIYHYRYSPSKGKYVPVVTAVVSWQECQVCTDDDDYPNHARRITPWFLGRISWLKEQFP